MAIPEFTNPQFLVVIILTASAFISLASVVTLRRTLHAQRIMHSWIVNHDLRSRASGQLISDTNLLRILGIDPDELAKDGISPTELVYINMSLDASSAFYSVSTVKAVELTHFRKNFFKNGKVRLAWKKYLRETQFNESPWRLAVDEYIDKFEKQNQPRA